MSDEELKALANVRSMEAAAMVTIFVAGLIAGVAMAVLWIQNGGTFPAGY
jgi:CII-binding regulator of phage lambda lysogenization HflD